MKMSRGKTGFPGGTSGVSPPANTGDTRDDGLILGSGRSFGGGNGNPLQSSFLENPMDRGALRAAVYRVTNRWTWLKPLSTHARREEEDAQLLKGQLLPLLICQYREAWNNWGLKTDAVEGLSVAAHTWLSNPGSILLQLARFCLQLPPHPAPATARRSQQVHSITFFSHLEHGCMRAVHKRYWSQIHCWLEDMSLWECMQGGRGNKLKRARKPSWPPVGNCSRMWSEWCFGCLFLSSFLSFSLSLLGVLNVNIALTAEQTPIVTNIIKRREAASDFFREWLAFLSPGLVGSLSWLRQLIIKQ